jgi:hypothetical protein
VIIGARTRSQGEGRERVNPLPGTGELRVLKELNLEGPGSTRFEARGLGGYVYIYIYIYILYIYTYT